MYLPTMPLPNYTASFFFSRSIRGNARSRAARPVRSLGFGRRRRLPSVAAAPCLRGSLRRHTRSGRSGRLQQVRAQRLQGSNSSKSEAQCLNVELCTTECLSDFSPECLHHLFKFFS